jgi:hypothetical protein
MLAFSKKALLINSEISMDLEDKYEELYGEILLDIIDECKMALQDNQAHGWATAYAENIAEIKTKEWAEQQPEPQPEGA